MSKAAMRFEPADFHRDRCEACGKLFPNAMLALYVSKAPDDGQGPVKRVLLCMTECGPAAEKHPQIQARRQKPIL